MAERRVTFIVGSKIRDFQKKMNRVSDRFKTLQRDATRVGKRLSAALTIPLVLAGSAAVSTAIDFEDAFAGVRKTVDATEVQFDGLRSGIIEMSKELPTSANEIAGVSEAAGQLGIQTDKILSFSKTMVMLGDTTNMAASEAATSLARFTNIMQLPQDQFDRIGSTIVDLGNNFATTEAEITEFATRMAGSAKVAGVTADQVFAISTALSSVGVRAESGGTAMQKALLNINDAVVTGNSNLAVFAETADMSASSFQEAWRKDAGEAFTAFVEGLGRSGDGATTILSEVGLNSERVRAAFLSLAGAGDLLSRSMDTGAKAWEENTALTAEAEQRYNTMASRLGKLRNRLRAVAIVIGDRLMPYVEAGMEKIEGLTNRFDSFSDQTIDRLLEIAGILAVSGPIIVGLGMVAGAIAAIVSPVGAVITAIGGLAAAIFYVYDNWQAVIERVSDIDWWRNTLIDMIQFFIDWNPFNIIWRAYNSLMDLMGGAQLANPFEVLTDGLESLKAETKEYEHDFKGFNETVQNAMLGLSGFMGLDFTPTTMAGSPSPTSGGQASNRSVEIMNTAAGATSLISTEMSSAFRKIGARDTADGAIEAMKDIGVHAEGTGKKMKDFASESGSAWDRFVNKSKEAGFDFVNFLSGNVSNAISSFSESVGMAMSGTENSFASGFEKIILLVTDFAKQLGNLLIGMGTAIMLVPGLQGPAGLYIAGGSALTAIATGVSAGIQNRIKNREDRANEMSVNDALIRSDGSVIKLNPRDNVLAMQDFTKLGANAQGGGFKSNRLHITGELRARGTDMVLALEDAKYTLS